MHGTARIDQLIKDSTHKLGAAGVALSIVGPGGCALTRGYGFADVRARVEASERTLLRIGSTSKVVTATAVMQLVESGELDLDADVNQYLESQLQLRGPYARPVTLKNLLTHTAGFEENQLGYMIKRSAADLVSLAQNLADNKPAQVRAPTTEFADGRSASYSNWGMALAGHIVARRTRMSFDDYVERHVFQPLGMTHSSFREPVPHELGQLSVGYGRGAAGAFTEHGFEFFHSIGPAGSMSTTADDMALFMRAHLGMGPSTLRRDTTQLMQSRVLDPHPMVNGAGLGFYEINLKGRRAVGHQGSTICFVSQLVLLPQEGVGVFVAANTRIPARRMQGFVTGLIDALLPAHASISMPPLQQTTSLSRYVGTYLATPHSHRRKERCLLLAVPNYEMNVSVSGQGRLRITNLAGGREWVEIARGVFRQEGSQEVVAFVDDASGNVSHMLGPAPSAPAYKVECSETPAFHRELLAHAATGFHLALGWRSSPIGAGAISPGMRPILHVAAMVAALNLVGLSLVQEAFADGGVSLVYDYPESFCDGITSIALASELSRFVLQLTLSAWVHEQGTQAERQEFALFNGLLQAFFGSLRCWNLVGTFV